MPNQNYIFTNTADQAEFERLRLIEKAYDPHTKKHLKELGFRPGMSALEVGPGAGSIMEWMAETAGELGKVTAVDMNTRFISQVQKPNLTIVQGDAARVDLGQNVFDFVHARNVFIHVHDYKALFQKLLDALKPGGWILIEDPDFSSADPLTDDPKIALAFYNVRDAIRIMFTQMNLDPTFGSKLPYLFREFHLQNIASDKLEEAEPGGSTIAEMMKRSTLVLKDKYIATGAVQPADIENYSRLAEDSIHSAVYYTQVSAWGQKPK